MWVSSYKEGWALKNWCFHTVVLEETLESPLDCKKMKPVYPEGNQSWILIGRTDAKAEALILWPSNVRRWLIGKDPDAGKDWGQEEMGMTEDEMVGWYHQVDGYEFEQASGDSEGQRSLACCTPWVTNSQLWLSNWTTANNLLNVITHLESQKYDMKASIVH